MFSPYIVEMPSGFSLDIHRVSHLFNLIAKALPDIPQYGILNIAFLSDEEIRELNRSHRGIDKTTDVLSFHYFDDFSDIGNDMVAGEIILSESKIISQAAEHVHSQEKECEILILHSVLHILGFDHETDDDYVEMWRIEEPLRDALKTFL